MLRTFPWQKTFRFNSGYKDIGDSFQKCYINSFSQKAVPQESIYTTVIISLFAVLIKFKKINIFYHFKLTEI